MFLDENGITLTDKEIIFLRKNLGDAAKRAGARAAIFFLAGCSILVTRRGKRISRKNLVKAIITHPELGEHSFFKIPGIIGLVKNPKRIKQPSSGQVVDRSRNRKSTRRRIF